MQVARRQSVSARTVDVCLARQMRKTGAMTKAGLVHRLPLRFR